MLITSVRLSPAPQIDQDHGLLAYGSIEFDKCFVIHDIKLLNRGTRRQNGLFVQMPCRPSYRRCIGCNRKTPMKERLCRYCKKVQPLPGADDHFYQDQCHPTTPEWREAIEKAVVAEWNRIASASAGGDHRDEIPEEIFGGGLVDA